MRAYLIRRLLLIIPTLWILTTLVFLSVRFLPGDTVDAIIGEVEAQGVEVDRAAIERMLGLDVPAWVQYGRWIGVLPTPHWITGESEFNGFLQGTLGDSLLGFRSVEEKIIGRVPVTIQLGVMAIVIGLLIALPVGIYSAIRQDNGRRLRGALHRHHRPGHAQLLARHHGHDLPGHLVGLGAAAGAGCLHRRTALGNLAVFIIPSLILGTASAAGTMRMTRTMMLEVLRQDYIRTAWSKGLKERVRSCEARHQECPHPGGFAGRPAAAYSGRWLRDHGEHIQPAGAGSAHGGGTE